MSSTPTLLIRWLNQNTRAVTAAAMRNALSNTSPNTWNSGRVEKRFTTPMSGCVSGRAGGGGNDVRS